MSRYLRQWRMKLRNALWRDETWERRDWIERVFLKERDRAKSDAQQ